MSILFILTLFMTLEDSFALECGPWEIPIRSHPLKYDSASGAKEITSRKQHCREIYSHSNLVVAAFKNAPPSNKVWSKSDTEKFLHAFSKVSPHLIKYSPKFIYRLVNQGDPKNPAMVRADTLEMWVSDSFFNSPNLTQVLNHELSHILFHRITREERILFSLQSGWTVNPKTNSPSPPSNLLLPDSSASTSEDFANHVEWWLHEKENRPLKPEMNFLLKKILESSR